MALTLPVGNKPPQVESGHWYDRDGRPAYEQATKAGGVRATDLRDARKLGLLPSVTTVLSVVDKAALVDFPRQMHGFVPQGKVIDEAKEAVRLCVAEVGSAMVGA